MTKKITVLARALPFGWLIAMLIGIVGCQIPNGASPTDSSLTVSPTYIVTTSAPTFPTAVPPLQLWASGSFGETVTNQLQIFKAQYPQSSAVRVREKDLTDAQAAVLALQSARVAAPTTLPDVILVNNETLLALGSAGLLVDLNDWLSPLQQAEYVPSLLETARQGEALWGVPVGMNPIVAVTLPSSYPNLTSLTWDSVLRTKVSLVFAGDDPQALSVLQLYLHAGGAMPTVENGVLRVDEDALLQVFQWLQAARNAGILPTRSLTFTNTHDVWMNRVEFPQALVVTDLRTFLQDSDRSLYRVFPMPYNTDSPRLVGEVWHYALVAHDSPVRSEARALLQWLLQPQQYDNWRESAGLLPSQIGALDSWEATYPSLGSETLANRLPLPARAILAPWGEALKDVMPKVLRLEIDPHQATDLVLTALSE